MTTDQLQSIESTLELKLPEFYRRFMLAFPGELEHTTILVGSSPQTPAEWECLGTAQRLIETNQFVRDPEIEWLADGGPWPANKFAIGEDIGGDYFAIELIGGQEVFCYDHENGEFVVCAASLRVHADQVLDQYRAFDERKKR
jgi:SMI1-KNR4 cell-wall